MSSKKGRTAIRWNVSPVRILTRVLAPVVLQDLMGGPEEAPFGRPHTVSHKEYEEETTYVVSGILGLDSNWQLLIPDVDDTKVVRAVWGRAYTPFASSKYWEENPEINAISAPYLPLARFLLSVYREELVPVSFAEVVRAAEKVADGVKQFPIQVTDLRGTNRKRKQYKAPSGVGKTDLQRTVDTSTFKTKVQAKKDQPKKRDSVLFPTTRSEPKQSTSTEVVNVRPELDLAYEASGDWGAAFCQAHEYSKEYLQKKEYWPNRLLANRHRRPSVLYIEIQRSRVGSQFALNRKLLGDVYQAYITGKISDGWVVFVERTPSDEPVSIVSREHVYFLWHELKDKTPRTSLDGYGDFYWVDDPGFEPDPDDVL